MFSGSSIGQLKKRPSPVLERSPDRPNLRTEAQEQIAAVVIAVAASIYITGYSLSATLTVVLLAMTGIIVVLKLPAAKDP